VQCSENSEVPTPRNTFYVFSKCIVKSTYKIFIGRFQDGNYREEAENILPKVKSWRDAGNTPCRKNHREEAKL
jgi:hypothetical protein